MVEPTFGANVVLDLAVATPRMGSAQGWTFFTGATTRLVDAGYQAKTPTIS